MPPVMCASSHHRRGQYKRSCWGRAVVGQRGDGDERESDQANQRQTVNSRDAIAAAAANRVRWSDSSCLRRFFGRWEAIVLGSDLEFAVFSCSGTLARHHRCRGLCLSVFGACDRGQTVKKLRIQDLTPGRCPTIRRHLVCGPTLRWRHK
jgi:hypothetical protein